jgi:hypothetical protein
MTPVNRRYDEVGRGTRAHGHCHRGVLGALRVKDGYAGRLTGVSPAPQLADDFVHRRKSAEGVHCTEPAVN